MIYLSSAVFQTAIEGTGAAFENLGASAVSLGTRPISYDFDPSASNLHPLDVEATKELERLDAGIESALNAATVDMAGGASSTGVRAWRKFCALFELRVLRPLDSMSSLRDKLAEKRLVLRFIMWLVDSRDIKASSAANYLGSVQGWHLRQTGVKLAAGIRLARVAELVKGLRRLRGDPGRRVRQGVSPDVLRQQMDKLLDPATMDGANMRAALSLGFQAKGFSAAPSSPCGSASGTR